jgi:antitoxin (DNA-binding transcriptional repressor) of toxin-antitoxin stability system
LSWRSGCWLRARGFFAGRLGGPKSKAYDVQNIAHILRQKEFTMGIAASDVIPLSLARATLSDLADQVRAGSEKIITKNGESYVALIDAGRLDYYHQLERERIHLLLISEASKGLDDVAAGRVKDARASLQAIKRRRAAQTKG